MDATNSFGQKLRELRGKRGFSLQKLAERLTSIQDASQERSRVVNRSYISDLERGLKPAPSRQQIDRIAQALRCTPQERAELYLSAGFLPPEVPGGASLDGVVAALRGTRPQSGATGSADTLPARAGDSNNPTTVRLPEHDFAVRLTVEPGSGLCRKGDILLIKVAEEIPEGSPAAYQWGEVVQLRRYEREASRPASQQGAGNGFPPGARGRLLGRVVGFVRTW